MDQIYDHVDNLMSTDNWTQLNTELEELITHVDVLNIDFMIGVACSTLPAEDKVIARSYFVSKCKEKYSDSNLWHGL